MRWPAPDTYNPKAWITICKEDTIDSVGIRVFRRIPLTYTEALYILGSTQLVRKSIALCACQKHLCPHCRLGCRTKDPSLWPWENCVGPHYLNRILSKAGHIPWHSAHLGHFRRLPPASEIRLGRNGQFWDILWCGANEYWSKQAGRRKTQREIN